VGHRRRRLGQNLFNVVGLLVIVSMVIGGLSVAIIPSSRPTPTPFPTLALPTATATIIATPSATATPVAEPVATPIPLGSRDEQSFTFAVCGDNRGGDEVYKEILRRVQEDEAAFLVSTGDLVQSGTEREFQDFETLMSDFTLPFFPAPGNHDSPDGLLDEYLQYSGAPAAHYSFDYGLGHFVGVDSHSGMMFPKELEWLEADLAATEQPLKVIFLHHPPFDPDGTTHIMQLGNDEFMALMEKHDVAYVFAGHIHAYAEETRNGVHYIITGGAGAPLYAAEHPQAFYHYVRVTVNGTDVSTEVVKVEP
jgi:predicted phosphodiesterase